MLDLGFKVFPLKANSKTPAFTGWQEWARSSSPLGVKGYEANNPGCNWGVFLDASGHCAVDVDMKSGGLDSMQELICHGKLPTTFAVKTPNDGLHFYYKGQIKNSQAKIAKGIDTRGIGGYVVAPGSVIDGRSYEYAEDGADIIDVPQWIVEALGKEVASPVNELPTVVELDTQENIDRATDYLLFQATPCVEDGQPSGEHLLQIFYEVRDRGISMAKARQLVLTYYNDRCSPPWNLEKESDADHFEAKLKNAYRYAQNKPIGVKTAAGQLALAQQEFGGVPQTTTVYQEENKPETEMPQVLQEKNTQTSDSVLVVTNDFTNIVQETKTHTNLLQTPAKKEESRPFALSELTGTAPHRKWIIKDWLPMNEVSSMYGKGGSGKSLISMQLAIAAATGTPFFNIPVESAMPTLAVFCEDSKEELHRRKESIMKAPEFQFINDQIAEIPLLLWPRVGEANDLAKLNEHKNDVVPGAFMAPLRKTLEAMPKGPKLLILDTLSDIYLGDENVRDQVNKFVKYHLGGLVKLYDLTVLVLAHPSRSGQNSGDMLSGSTAWENAVRNRWTLGNWEKGSEVKVLRRAKSNYAKTGEEILVVWDDGRMRIADEAKIKSAELKSEEHDMLRALNKELPEGETGLGEVVNIILTGAARAMFIGMHKSTIMRRLESLFIKGVTFEGATYSMVYNTSEKAKNNQKKFVKKAAEVVAGEVE